jgi:cysteine desulfurase / selenocysteine lyase
MGPERRRVYLDHAATSWPKPPAVWEAVLFAGRDVGAPAGRSGYAEALESDRTLERARAALARLLGGTPDRVAFTLNATDGLNMALQGVLGPGDHAVTTAIEHNSVVRPLRELELRRGVEVTRVPAAGDGMVDPGDIARAIRPSTRLVAVLHASNVCGVRLPIAEIGRIARERGARLLVDAAQTAGSFPIDMEEDGIDFLAVPGHKGLLGPLGTGALLLGKDVELTGLRQGGTGTRSEEPEHPRELPEGLEAGSPNVPGIAGLLAGVERLLMEGVEAVAARLERLAAELQAGLEQVPGLVWYGPRDLKVREPIYPVNLAGYHPQELAAALESGFRVQTRAGLHCAPGAHRAIGTFPGGACRLSLGATSELEDVQAALAALRELAADQRA